MASRMYDICLQHVDRFHRSPQRSDTSEVEGVVLQADGPKPKYRDVRDLIWSRSDGVPALLGPAQLLIARLIYPLVY